jgi:protein associated with RNAse G/E
MLLEVEVHKMLVDGSEWGKWKGYQLPLSDDYVSIWTPFGTAMHWRPATWISKSHSLSYFWPHAWYTIHVGYDQQDGHFVSGYCDIVLPTEAYTSASRNLIYVDLYIDVVIREDFSVYTKDQEVFERAAQRYPIVEQVRERSFAVLSWLEQEARCWSGPFAVIPRRLPTTDWERLSKEEMRAALEAAL